jgi:hypothetical protein
MNPEHFQRFTSSIQTLFDLNSLVNYPKTVRIYEAIKRLSQSGKIDQTYLDELTIATKQ